MFKTSLDGESREELFAYRPGEEFLWSPDSNNLLVSFCFGSMGPCGISATIDGSDAITEIVRRQFASTHKDDECYKYGNIGALTWLDNADKIVVMAEVPPSPQCKEHGGYFEAMVVSLSQRKVLAQYNMQDTIHRWGNILGAGLLKDIKLVREDTKGTQR